LSLGVFIISVFVGLLVLMIVLFVPLLYFVGKIGPARFFSSTFGAASIAFSTTSTAAAIPVSLEETTKNLKVPESIADLLIPLGASMYRPGSALFQGAAIVFLAHLYGVPIPAAAIGAAILATFLVSLTVAPVPSSGVVTMMPALETVGVPIAGLSFLLGIDRIPDMMRSAVNVLSQITTAVLVGRWTDDKQDQPGRD
jgi:Na+/H+-dicarboxylate symporter